MYMAVLLVSIGAMIVAGIAAVAAIVQANTAVRARDDAKAAQSGAEAALLESQQLMREGNDARLRQADAAERAIALEEARTMPRVDWATATVGNPAMYHVVNQGKASAYGVRLTGTAGIYLDDDSASEVVAEGGDVEFGFLHYDGRPETVTVHWADEPRGEERTRGFAVRPSWFPR